MVEAILGSYLMEEKGLIKRRRKGLLGRWSNTTQFFLHELFNVCGGNSAGKRHFGSGQNANWIG